MLWRRAVIIVVTTLVAVIVELTLLSRLGLPGATPDLVVVTVVALALAMGPVEGAVAGFFAGMLVDLAPPADTTLGVNAIVYVVIGFAAALFVDRRDRTVPLLIAIVAVSAAAATLGVAALDSLLGSARVQWDSMAVMVVTSAIYAVVMAPVVVLGIAWLVRRIAPEDAAIVTG